MCDRCVTVHLSLVSEFFSCTIIFPVGIHCLLFAVSGREVLALSSPPLSALGSVPLFIFLKQAIPLCAQLFFRLFPLFTRCPIFSTELHNDHFAPYPTVMRGQIKFSAHSRFIRRLRRLFSTRFK